MTYNSIKYLPIFKNKKGTVRALSLHLLEKLTKHLKAEWQGVE